MLWKGEELMSAAISGQRSAFSGRLKDYYEGGGVDLADESWKMVYGFPNGWKATVISSEDTNGIKIVLKKGSKEEVKDWLDGNEAMKVLLDVMERR